MAVTTKQAIEKAGGVMKLAEVFGITHGAVSQWRRNKFLPYGRALQLRHNLKPEWFNKDGSLKS